MDTLKQWNDLAENVAETADEVARKAADVTRKASHSKPARTMTAASEQIERTVANRTANALWRSVWMGAAGAAAVTSLGMMLSNKKHEALYVGQWVPSLMIVALWGQVVKES